MKLILLPLLFFQLVFASPIIGSSAVPASEVEEIGSLNVVGAAGPLFFEENRGQADPAVVFLARGTRSAVFLTPTEIVTVVGRDSQLPEIVTAVRRDSWLPDEVAAVVAQGAPAPTGFAGNVVRLTLSDAVPVRPRGESLLKGQAAYYIGNDKTRWQQGIPLYQGVTYPGIYPGVDMLVTADQGIHYAFRVAPGADPARIQLQIEGAHKIGIDQWGNLVITTSGGPIVHTRPTFLEGPEGNQKRIEGGFRLLAPDRVGFEVHGRTTNAPLLIDPEIVFTSYVGGTNQEGMLGTNQRGQEFIGQGFDIAVGPQGDIYVVGMTLSADFPITAGPEFNGNADVFVFRLNMLDILNTGSPTVVYATFVGGSSSERGRGITALPDGSAYIVGHSSSSDFPVTDGTVHSARAISGGYVVNLDSLGNLVAGSYVGPTGNYHPNAVVFDPYDGGGVYVVGAAGSNHGDGDPTTGAFQPTHGGGAFDGFVTKFSPDLQQLLYFTFLGGSARDVIMDVAVHNGYAFVAGATASVNFPTTELAAQEVHSLGPNAAQQCAPSSPPRSCFDAFVARLNQVGTGLIYSSFFGGEGEDYGRGIAVDAQGRAVLTGAALLPDATTDADIFIAKIEALGGSFLFDLRLTGALNDRGEEVAVDAQGNAHVAGTVSRNGLATGSGVQLFHGGSDMFYARTTPAGDLSYFSYLGGQGDDQGFAVAAEVMCAHVAGATVSRSIQTLNPVAGGEAPIGNNDVLLYALCEPGEPGPPVRNPISKRVLQGQARPGEEVEYEIRIQNERSSTISNVTVTDRIQSDQLTIIGVLPAICAIQSSTAVSCAGINIPGEGLTIKVKARVNANCNRNQTVINQAKMEYQGVTFEAPPVSLQLLCVPVCGNGVIEPGEQCDGGANCRSDCTIGRCGDGRLDPGEQCDDGNRNNNDNCTNQCRSQLTGNQECASGGTPCAPGLVCARTGTVVEECNFGFFGWCWFVDDYWVFSTQPRCMEPGNGVFPER